ncbi:hypothetical protein J6590_060494 [Homalodisca vitripennis]|nr:hypothetical protein J6590_060494 [Homalodisca vitripennis]
MRGDRPVSGARGQDRRPDPVSEERGGSAAGAAPHDPEDDSTQQDHHAFPNSRLLDKEMVVLNFKSTVEFWSGNHHLNRKLVRSAVKWGTRPCMTYLYLIPTITYAKMQMNLIAFLTRLLSNVSCPVSISDGWNISVTDFRRLFYHSCVVVALQTRLTSYLSVTSLTICCQVRGLARRTGCITTTVCPAESLKLCRLTLRVPPVMFRLGLARHQHNMETLTRLDNGAKVTQSPEVINSISDSEF